MRSFFKLSEANCNAIPWLRTANKTTSLSSFKSLWANSNIKPFCLTAAITNSLFFFISSEANFNISPFIVTADKKVLFDMLSFFMHRTE